MTRSKLPPPVAPRQVAMMAPAVTELMAEWMTGGAPDEIFERFTLQRFERGETAREDFIIG
jgi:sarcosine oxidase subunit beta